MDTREKEINRGDRETLAVGTVAIPLETVKDCWYRLCKVKTRRMQRECQGGRVNLYKLFTG